MHTLARISQLQLDVLDALHRHLLQVLLLLPAQQLLQREGRLLLPVASAEDGRAAQRGSHVLRGGLVRALPLLPLLPLRPLRPLLLVQIHLTRLLCVVLGVAAVADEGDADLVSLHGQLQDPLAHADVAVEAPQDVQPDQEVAPGVFQYRHLVLKVHRADAEGQVVNASDDVAGAHAVALPEYCVSMASDMWQRFAHAADITVISAPVSMIAGIKKPFISHMTWMGSMHWQPDSPNSSRARR
eukprot:CAMPEP_0173212410 /NCGR_PEP_ID=MMETSP1141-20130122/24777_1 /TAXON_ID=483371 /ORGANISM="non described non described, Strain CCMP2298" /LENGTH=241 /DNA_ID=CAMNT_0014139411 /DNA_START=185 /DNA_END=909 /DNA_ORIENTATION=-